MAYRYKRRSRRNYFARVTYRPPRWDAGRQYGPGSVIYRKGTWEGRYRKQYGKNPAMVVMRALRANRINRLGQRRAVAMGKSAAARGIPSPRIRQAKALGRLSSAEFAKELNAVLARKVDPVGNPAAAAARVEQVAKNAAAAAAASGGVPMAAAAAAVDFMAQESAENARLRSYLQGEFAAGREMPIPRLPDGEIDPAALHHFSQIWGQIQTQAAVDNPAAAEGASAQYDRSEANDAPPAKRSATGARRRLNMSGPAFPPLDPNTPM